MRKILLMGFWFTGSLLTLILALFTLSFSTNVKGGKEPLSHRNQYEFYAALPQVMDTFTTSVQAADARPELIRRYLEKYQSPLLPHADLIVKLSDEYSLDFRLMVAIGQCESNVCKRIPANSYNCWGFGNGQSKFSSWENALAYVAKTLKESYIDYGLNTPELMMPKYVPPSVEKGGPWAKCVNQFLSEIQ